MNEVEQIISGIKYAVLATVSEDGQPWNTPFFASIDKDLNIYWDSSTESQHSRNIQANSKVFIVIFDSITEIEGKTKQGVYIKARASLVEDPDGMNYYFKLREKGPKPLSDTTQFKGKSPKRIYKAIPDQVWINDRVVIDGRKVDIRKEVPLS